MVCRNMIFSHLFWRLGLEKMYFSVTLSYNYGIGWHIIKPPRNKVKLIGGIYLAVMAQKCIMFNNTIQC